MKRGVINSQKSWVKSLHEVIISSIEEQIRACISQMNRDKELQNIITEIITIANNNQGERIIKKELKINS